MKFRSTAENSKKPEIVPISVSVFKAIQSKQHIEFVNSRQLTWIGSLVSTLSWKHHLNSLELEQN